MAELLASRKEQEKFLLETLVNKLGHPRAKIGPCVANQLEKLVQTHPNMRPVVIDEIETVVFRWVIDFKVYKNNLIFL